MQSGREYALYLRKSKGRAGIARQRSTTTAHIHRLGGVIAAEFPDTDRTAFQQVNGSRPDREGFDALLAMLRARPGLHVAAWHADRLTRNTEDTETLLAVCAAGGHIIETPRGGTYDVTTATGRKRLRQDALDANYEVDHNTERVIAAKEEARAGGLWLGGRRPFGWQAGGMTLWPAEAKAILDGTLAVSGGASVASIQRQWHAAGLLTTSGRRWAPREVSRVLRRARNAGLAEHNGEITGTAAWEPIVPEAAWLRCKTILESPARRTSRGNQPRWLLSCIATCGVCGETVIVTKSRGRPVYRDLRDGHRGHVARDVASLDAYVREMAIAWLERYGKDAITPPTPDLSLLGGELRALRAELDTLTQAAEERSIGAGQLVRASRPINAAIQAAEARLAAVTPASPLRALTGDDVRAIWDAADLDVRRAAVRALMGVTIHPSPRGRPKGPHTPGEPYFRPETVSITWKQGDGGEAGETS